MNRRIDILIPVHLPEWWKALAIERYAKHATEATTVVGVDLSPQQQERLTEDALPDLLLENATRQETKGVDGHILDCFSDPGLARLARSLRKPVVGVGQAGLWYGHGRFERFCVITSERPTADRILENAAEWSLDLRLVGVAAVDVPAGEVPDDPEAAFEACVRESLAFENHVDGVILGCTELAEFAGRLEKRLAAEGVDVRVVNPIAVAIRLAELRALLEAESPLLR